MITKRNGIVIVMVCLFMFGACQQLDFSKVGGMLQGGKKIVVEPVDFDSLLPSITQAVVAVETAKKEELASLPFAEVDSSAEISIDKQNNASNFKIESLVILDYVVGPDGIITLKCITESADAYSRKDRRFCTLVYTTRQPKGQETKEIQAWLLKKGRIFFAQADDTIKNAVSDFQKEKGLTPDGRFGSKSAETLAKELSMIQIKKLESFILYPEVPNHMVFVLPYGVFKQEESKLSKGYQSLLEVGKRGLSLQEFGTRVTKGEQFVVFVYFFDRVDPARAISVGFSKTSKRRELGSVSSNYHVMPDTWPVIVETFIIDEKKLSSLYLNVFMKDQYLHKCVASHKLL